MSNDCLLKPRIVGWRQTGQIEGGKRELKNLWCLFMHIR